MREREIRGLFYRDKEITEYKEEKRSQSVS